MRRFNAFVIASLVFALTLMSGGVAGAASYQRTDGTIVDPILHLNGSVSTYSGPDLRPDSAYAEGLILVSLDLTEVDLSGSIAPGLNLEHAPGADLSGFSTYQAVFSGSFVGANFLGSSLNLITAGGNFEGANFSQSALNPDGEGLIFGSSSFAYANFFAADLSGITFDGVSLPSIDLTGAYFAAADLTGAIGLDTTSGAAHYDINTDFTGTGFDPVAAGWTLVPEPGTALLLGLGLTALAVRRGE